MESWLENFARANFQRSADTAHDLKTPLNVAVLNLELLRMRLRKIAGEDDEKIVSYTHAIEAELRRLGRIFDAFFLLSTPPKNDQPTNVNVAAVSTETAIAAGFSLATNGNASILGHESRIRQAYKLFFEGASKAFAESNAVSDVGGGRFNVTLTGTPAAPDFELTKLFKFYYSDAEGNPDLSLAVARLIAETYGGELNAAVDRDKVVLRLSLPLGAQ